VVIRGITATHLCASTNLHISATAAAFSILYREIWLDGLRSLDEELDRVVLQQGIRLGQVSRDRNRQGWNMIFVLGGEVEHRAAGRQDRDLRAGDKDARHCLRCREQMLKVIQHEEVMLLPEMLS
jgi:hypothetical protein